MKHKKYITGLILMAAISASHATPLEHYVVAPQCLLTNSGKQFTALASDHEFKLIKTDRAGLDALISAKANHKVSCGGFFNVSNAWLSYKNNKSISHSYKGFLKQYLPKAQQPTLNSVKYKIRYQQEVNDLLKTINPDAAWANLTTLTSFKDRYANSQNGVDAANWFVDQIKEMATKYNRTDISVMLVETGSYKQPSVVVKVGDASTKPGIVIGGHLDTLSSSWSKKPGADDDGSGSVTVLEVARTIIASGLTFNKPIYFMWYAAEEEGLVGSQVVVDTFKEQKIAVDAVIHFDMTGYAYKNEKTMWLMDDYVNKDLTAFLEQLIKKYVKVSVQHSACGYGCSDHASWTQGGYIAAFPFEASFGNDDPYIHTSNDTMDHLSQKHLTDYVKLGVAFAVELAEPAKK